jgi:pyruvate/2-oxoglutarate dehydrogenase complex dihydrolipoamide acyltransferase (E2) component
LGKIDVAVNAPEAGTIMQWFVSAEDNVEVGQKLCEIDTEAKASGRGGGEKPTQGTKTQKILSLVLKLTTSRNQTPFRTKD